MASHSLISIAVGLLLLLAGRRLYLLLISVIGFMLGLEASNFIGLDPQPFYIHVIIGIAMGLVGVLLIRFVQEAAPLVVGAFWGAYTGLALSHYAERAYHLHFPVPWIAPLLGAIVGALFLWFIFDWALIVFSSSCGALLILESLPIAPRLEWGVALLLTALGIFIQSAWDRK